MSGGRVRGGKYVILAAQFVLLVLGVIAYREAPRLYYAYLAIMGGIPTDGPFSDLHFVFAAFDCVRHGIDPYFDPSCMPKGDYFNYAPALLWMGAIPITSAWTLPAGLVLDLLFLLSFLLLPEPRSRGEFIVRFLAGLSSAVVYAAIAANIDIVLFMLSVVAAALLLRPGGTRFLAYLLVFVAAAVKLYPAALFGLALRERPRIMLAIAGCAIAAAAAYSIAVLPHLEAMSRHLPTGPYLMNWFGAVNLPHGLAEILRALGIDAPPVVAPLIEALLIAATFAQVARLVAASPLPVAFSRLGARDKIYLAAGSMIVVGCFFAWQNLGYRGIYLVLVLPGLAALAPDRRDSTAWRMPARTAVLVVFLMWTEFGRHSLYQVDEALRAPGIVRFVLEIGFWLVKELAWWRVVAVLTAMIVCFVRQSASYRAAFPGLVSS